MTFNMFSQAEGVLTLFTSLDLGFQVIERTFVLSLGFIGRLWKLRRRGREATQR